MDPLTEPLIMFPNEEMERADLTAEYVDLEIDRVPPGLVARLVAYPHDDRLDC